MNTQWGRAPAEIRPANITNSETNKNRKVSRTSSQHETKEKITRVCSVRYRYFRYRYACRTELTEYPVPVLISYLTYRSVRYRYWCCAEITEVSGTGMKVCIGTGGTGIHVVPNLPKCPVPVLMSYRTYRSVRYRYWCTELTEVSGTGIDVVPNLPKCPIPVLMSYRTYRSVRYR